MKKMFFSALAVIAIVGTTMAIDTGASVWCDVDQAAPFICDQNIPNRQLENNGLPVGSPQHCTTNPGGSDCATAKQLYQSL